MKGITVSVNYSDLLRLSLEHNLHHLDEVVVVTSPADLATQRLVDQFHGARLHITDAFYRQGAMLNKGAALEEGLDVLGRDGWLMIFDADTLLPDKVDWRCLDAFRLYVPHRRMLYKPADYHEGLDWSTLPLKYEPGEWPGYCQIAHASDPYLVGQRPWYGVDWQHAGGCDTEFQQHWPASHKVRPPFEVLHLGQDGKNWAGRVTPRLDGVTLDNQEARLEFMHRVDAEPDFRYRKLP